MSFTLADLGFYVLLPVGAASGYAVAWINLAEQGRYIGTLAITAGFILATVGFADHVQKRREVM